MARTKKGLPATQSKQEVVKVQTARIIEPDDKGDVSVPMPDVGFEVEQEAPSSLTPIVDFQQKGDWIAGEYVGTRINIGPNASMLYDLKVDGHYFCSIWGSTILDTKIQMLNPKSGQHLLVQFTGLIPTSRNQNPAKNFRVAIIKEQKEKEKGKGDTSIPF